MLREPPQNCQAERKTGSTPEALVILIGGHDAQARTDAFRRHWQHAVPGAEFVSAVLEVNAGPSSTKKLIVELMGIAASRSLDLSRAILLGEGETGRAVLDLILAGRIPAIGILAIDITLRLLPRRGPQSGAIVRLVQHGDAADPNFGCFFGLVDQIRQKTLDVRYALLPGKGEITTEPMLRAGRGYLDELVANASRLPSPDAAP